MSIDPKTAEDRSALNPPIVLLAGASGYVGGRLIPLLEQQPVVLRCLARNPDKLRPVAKELTQIVRGDVRDSSSLDEALQGVHTAYYLVHLMSGSQDFEKEDDKFGQLMRAGKKIYRYRVKDYRIYFERNGDIINVRCILSKNSLKDFFFRSKLPISEDQLLQDNPKFWQLLESGAEK